MQEKKKTRNTASTCASRCVERGRKIKKKTFLLAYTQYIIYTGNNSIMLILFTKHEFVQFFDDYLKIMVLLFFKNVLNIILIYEYITKKKKKINR